MEEAEGGKEEEEKTLLVWSKFSHAVPMPLLDSCQS